MICQLDGIAREGVSAQRHLSGPLCSPLRAGILTGPEGDLLRQAQEARREVIRVDDFPGVGQPKC